MSLLERQNPKANSLTTMIKAALSFRSKQFFTKNVPPKKYSLCGTTKKKLLKNLDFHGQSILHRTFEQSLGIFAWTERGTLKRALEKSIDLQALNWVILQCQLDWDQNPVFFAGYDVCDLNNGLLLIPYPFFQSANCELSMLVGKISNKLRKLFLLNE